MVFLFIKHEGGNGPTHIGTGSSLPMDMDSSMADAEMVGGTRDGAEGRRHDKKCDVRRDNQSG